jgi:hypothetical protein
VALVFFAKAPVVAGQPAERGRPVSVDS